MKKQRQKVVALILASVIGIVSMNGNALAATKSTSEVKDGYIYTYTVTTTKVEDKKKVVPNTNTMKNKYADIQISVTKSESWTISASTKFSVSAYNTLTKECGFSASVTGGVQAGRTFKIKASAPNGVYQVVTYFPGAEVSAKTTKRKNGDGNHQIMSDGISPKLEKIEVVDTSYSAYTPKKLAGGPIAEAVLVK